MMRVISIIVAIIVAFSLYFLIVDRNSLINFISKFQNEKKIEINLELNNQISEKQSDKSELPFVIVKNSIAEKTNNILVIRGRTEAIRKVEVRAEVNGGVISEPRLKGSRIKENETLCENWVQNVQRLYKLPRDNKNN